MNSSKPFVSVIMPVYNGAKFLPEAVQSIRQQSYHPLEIIIIDDGSTDETAKLGLNLGQDIRYIYQRNSGPSAARNRGLEMARGEIIGFLDADDLWPENKLQIQIARLTNDPKIDVVAGRIQYIELPGAEDINIQFEGPDNTLIHVHLGSAIFRKSVFDTVGLFDETLWYSEDHDWFLRAREQNISMVILKQTTLYYRCHESNMTRNKTIKDYQVLQVLKNSLDRRRQHKNGPAQPLRKWSEFDETKNTKGSTTD